MKEAYPEIVPDSFHFKSVSLDESKSKSEKLFRI